MGVWALLHFDGKWGEEPRREGQPSKPVVGRFCVVTAPPPGARFFIFESCGARACAYVCTDVAL